MRLWTAFLGGGLLAGAAFVGLGRACAEPTWPVPLLIGGQVPPAANLIHAWLSERAARVGARHATLLGDDGSFELSFEALGLSLDVEATEAQVRAFLPKRGGLLPAIRERWFPNPELTDLPLVVRFEPERAAQALERWGPSLHREPEAARIDLRAHAFIPARPGQELDLTGTMLGIAEGGREDGAVFGLRTRAIPAPGSGDTELAVDVTRVLASYETDFTHHAGPRAINIAVAARYLNGTVIAPGATFSFNRTVGPRTEERGFASAPQIVQDELESGIGGGVCQVASTLHAAAVFGGMEVLQRRSHSRPSGYTPLGLDATVIDGELDLKLRNPYPTALIVHAFLPSKTRLRVELLGRDADGLVEHFYEVKEKHEFSRRLVIGPTLSLNESERHQKGAWGYDVVSTVRTTLPNGERRFRSYKSTYYPVPEVYWVGPGTDPGSLPPLPEGASGVHWASDLPSPPG